MTLESLIIFLAIGAIAGWLAGFIMKGGGYGLLGDIALGVVGSFIGGLVFSSLGIFTTAGIVGTIIASTIGAIILIAILRLIKRA